MKDIPMIFNTEMVKSLINGSKAATRRHVMPKPDPLLSKCLECKDGWEIGLARYEKQMKEIKRPFSIGDIIYVRETFATLGHNDYQEVSPRNRTDIHEIRYKASEPDGLADHQDWEVRGYHWRPSIHMPRWASRLTLKVTNVQIERIQNITEEQSKKEGVPPSFLNRFGKMPVCPNYKDGFAKLWNSIYNDWDQNPFVWVIEFEVIHKNVDKVISEMKVAA